MANKKRSTSGELRESAQKIWLAGLGALATAEEEGGKLFTSLVSKGERYRSSARGPVDRAAESVRGRVAAMRTRAGTTLKRVEDMFDDQVTIALHRIGVPTRREIEALTKKVEGLTEKLGARPRAASKKAPRKRTTTSRGKAKKKKVARRKVAR